MDRRRILIILLLVLGFILIIGVVAFLVFGNGAALLGLGPEPTATAPPPTIAVVEGQPSPVATVAPEQEFVEVVVSLQTVPRGFQLTEAELTTEKRLATQVLPNVMVRLEDVVGKFARRDIFQGETITLDAIVGDVRTTGREDFGPASLIPPGYVAIAVPLDTKSSVGYSLEPGDFVDIMVSFLLKPVDEQFQTLLPNNATFYLNQTLETIDPEGVTSSTNLRVPYTLNPQGRFEELPNGDLANVSPSEDFPRGAHVAFIIQNAKVIEVGNFVPPQPPLLPTPTPDPDQDPAAEAPAEEQAQDTAVTGVLDQIDQLTQPPYNGVIVLALPPQQILILKYAIESQASIDYALRAHGDGELYAVDNVDLNYLIERFNVEIPPDFTYIVETEASYFQGFQDNTEVNQPGTGSEDAAVGSSEEGGGSTSEGGQ